MRKRRTHGPAFKAMVARETISGHKTIQEIAAGHAIHESQWKKHLLDGASELFRRACQARSASGPQATGELVHLEEVVAGSFRCCLVLCVKTVLRVVLAARQPGVLRKNRPPEGASGRCPRADPVPAGGEPRAERPAQRPGDGTRHLAPAVRSQFTKLLQNLPPAMALGLRHPIGAMVVATSGEDSRAFSLSYGRTKTMLGQLLETEISRGAIATIRERKTAALEHPVTEALNVAR